MSSVARYPLHVACCTLQRVCCMCPVHVGSTGPSKWSTHSGSRAQPKANLAVTPHIARSASRVAQLRRLVACCTFYAPSCTTRAHRMLAEPLKFSLRLVCKVGYSRVLSAGQVLSYDTSAGNHKGFLELLSALATRTNPARRSGLPESTRECPPNGRVVQLGSAAVAVPFGSTPQLRVSSVRTGLHSQLVKWALPP